MVLVPSGIFLQGTDSGPPECGPLHPAYVSSFYIDVTEVTLAQFERFQQRQRTQKKGTLPNPANIGDDPRKPVLGLSWKDADLYARQLGKELPTEAEWEKAARGAQGFSFPWGESRPAWDSPRQPGQIDPVGLYAADRSPFDVLDMAGNAREWCGDWYSPLTYQSVREKDGSPIRDSKGSPRAEPIGHRVVKGNPNGWESWHRGALPQRDGFPDVGFRCVLRGVELTSPAANSTAAPATGPARPVVAPEAPASKPASPF
jgi:formylglycine-generating enzyme required for sulfatase activity